MHDTAPVAAATAWLAMFSETLAEGDVAATLELFAEDCYWRDIVAFTWNVKTMEGKPAIAAMLEATLGGTSPSAWQVTSASGGRAEPLEAWFSFKTSVGQGQGIFTLEAGKCRTILTTLQALDGHEEAIGFTRPMGVRHGADRNRETWSEARAREEAAFGHGLFVMTGRAKTRQVAQVVGPFRRLPHRDLVMHLNSAVSAASGAFEAVPPLGFEP